MRKNKKMTSKMSVTITTFAHMGTVVALLIICSFFYMAEQNVCADLSKTIGERERQLRLLDKERDRVRGEWQALQTPEKLAYTLRKNGLAMRPPVTSQTIWMRADGSVRPNQDSIAQIRRRQANVAAVPSRR